MSYFDYCNYRRQSQVYVNNTLLLPTDQNEQISDEQVSNGTFALSSRHHYMLPQDAQYHRSQRSGSVRPELIAYAPSQCSAFYRAAPYQQPAQSQASSTFNEPAQLIQAENQHHLQLLNQHSSVYLMAQAAAQNAPVIQDTTSEEDFFPQNPYSNDQVPTCFVPYVYDRSIDMAELAVDEEDDSQPQEHHPNFLAAAEANGKPEQKVELPSPSSQEAEEQDSQIKSCQTNQATEKCGSENQIESEAFDEQSVQDLSTAAEISELQTLSPDSKSLPISEDHQPSSTVSMIAPSQVVQTTCEMPVASETEAESPARMFKCPHCPKEYTSSRALGGHTSKQHQGMSETYLRKMQVRQQRIGHRMALQMAKELCMRYGKGDISKEQRQLQTLIRNQIMIVRKAEIDQASVSGCFEQMPNSFYSKLLKEICAEGSPKASIFNKWLIQQN